MQTDLRYPFLLISVTVWSIWTSGSYHIACWGQPPFIWHERTPFPFHCCIWPPWAKQCIPTFGFTLLRCPCPTLPLVSHIFPTALLWGSKKFWMAFPAQTMDKHKAGPCPRGSSIAHLSPWAPLQTDWCSGGAQHQSQRPWLCEHPSAPQISDTPWRNVHCGCSSSFQLSL